MARKSTWTRYRATWTALVIMLKLGLRKAEIVRPYSRSSLKAALRLILRHQTVTTLEDAGLGRDLHVGAS